MTIKDIAKLAGVSTTTVSYALNDSGKVGTEVKQKILRIAKENNYRPNLIAKSLRSNRSKIIGILAEDINVLATPRIMNGIQQFADENDYQIVLNNLNLCEKIGNRYDEAYNYKDEIKISVNLMKGLQVDGIIYIGMHDRNISGLVETDRPIVYTYCYTDDQADYNVTYSNDISFDITSYLIENGHKNIGLISGPINSTPSHKRLLGYQTALMKHGVPLSFEYISVGNWEYSFAYDACSKFLEMSNRPTAIVAMNDIMAIGAIEAAIDKGFNVPNDLSIVGFDNTDIGKYYRPKLSTVDLPLKEIGNMAASIIDKIAKGEQIEQKNYILPCNLIKRETVKSIF